MISRRQAIVSVLLALIMVVVLLTVVKPLLAHMVRDGAAVASYVMMRGEASVEELRAENEALRKIADPLLQAGGVENGSAAWFDFLQDALRKTGVSVGRIQSAGAIADSALDRETFTIECHGAFHEIVRFVNLCETSGHICRAELVHMVAKSVLSEQVDVTIDMAFFRKQVQ